MNITLYCNCYKKRIPYKFQKNQKNLMLGSIDYDPNIKKTLLNDGYILDESGDNISNLNKWFGQTCGLYWTYKNSEEDFVGMSTYRIFWDEQSLSNIDTLSNRLYVPFKFDVTADVIDFKNLKNHFIVSHGNHSYKMLLDCIRKESILFEDAITWEDQTLLYPFSMFISNKKVFNTICEILFKLAFDFFYTNKYTIYNYMDHHCQIRQMDFICERLLHLIIKNLSFFIPNVEVIEIPIHQYSHIKD